MFNYEFFAVYKGLPIHILHSLFGSFVVFVVNEGVGVLQNDLFDAAKLGEVLLQVLFSGSLAEFGNIHLSEGFRVLVSLVIPISAVL